MKHPIEWYVRALANTATVQTLPQFCARSIRRWKNDALSRAGYYRWPEPILFIAGLPKSGSTWLERLLDAVPGLQREAHRGSGSMQRAAGRLRGDLLAHAAACYSVVKLHTRYSDANVSVLSRYRIKPVVLYRDLRDVCVSRYYHVLYDRWHREHALYRRLPKEEGLSHCIDTVTTHFPSWINQWLQYAKRRPDACWIIKYEDLRVSPAKVFRDLLGYYGIALDEQAFQHALDAGSAARFDVEQNLGQRLVRATARKGVIGDWRHHFTAAQVEVFKARCGKEMVEWEYERDLNW